MHIIHKIMNACIQHWLHTMCIPTIRKAVSVKTIAHKIVFAVKQTKDVVKNANVELTLLMSVKYCFKI